MATLIAFEIVMTVFIDNRNSCNCFLLLNIYSLLRYNFQESQMLLGVGETICRSILVALLNLYCAPSSADDVGKVSLWR